MINLSDTIVAISTPPGIGAIGVIRLSGPEAIAITNELFQGKNLQKVKSHTIHYGTIKDTNDQIVDEVVISIFKGPNSYTGEDVIEISCHGSPYILQNVLQLCTEQGARLAQPGEFTQRAFLNGKMDLARAEAVQDLIASENKAGHQLAIKQLRGGFTKDIEELRNRLIHFASMIELELDFGEEDVEFANRDELLELVKKVLDYIYRLTDSFQLGNAIKNGVATVIAGRPNAGKSTLLNALLNEERAIVSDIAGTTRDTIEEGLNINGVQFRLIDTAGIREAQDAIEKIGVERTLAEVSKSSVLVYVFDVTEMSPEDVEFEIGKILETREKRHEIRDKRQETREKRKETREKREETREKRQETRDRRQEKREKRDENYGDRKENNPSLISNLTSNNLLLVANKMDLNPYVKPDDYAFNDIPKDHVIATSAINHMNIEHLKDSLYHLAISTELSKDNTIVSNARHYEALSKAAQSLQAVIEGIKTNVSSDFVAMDIRHSLAYLGEITGEISTDDLLDRIFREFCIGK